MTKVFLSGSRMISRLDDEVSARLENIIARGHVVLTGDANGVDKAIQRFFEKHSYPDVTVYHVGDAPRNNVGAWRTVSVDVFGKFRGRDLYTQKDKRMAEVSDNGMIIWDGKSSGSVQNMIWMVSNFKPTLVYLQPIKKFFKINSKADIAEIMKEVGSDDLDEIDRKISIRDFLNCESESPTQGSLAF